MRPEVFLKQHREELALYDGMTNRIRLCPKAINQT
jgi:hypothetical protein